MKKYPGITKKPTGYAYRINYGYLPGTRCEDCGSFVYDHETQRDRCDCGGRLVVESRRFMPQVGGFATAKEAFDARTAALAIKGKVSHVLPSSMTCGQWAADWLERRRAARKELATIVGYESVIRTWWASFADIPLKNLQPEHLAEMQRRMDDKGLSPRQRKKVWTQTVAILRDAVRKRKIDWNPADAVDPPAGESDPDEDEMAWWEPETVAAFLKIADPALATDEEDFVLRSAVCLEFPTFLRPGELAGLKWTDRVVDKGQPVLRIRRSRSLAGWQVDEKSTKTASGRRDMWLTTEADEIWSALRKRRSLSHYVFSVGGVPVHPQKITKKFLSLQDEFRAEVDVRRLRFYDVRHTGITLALKAGVEIHKVSKAAGHSSVWFTYDHYVEVLGSDLSEAAALMSGRG